MTTSTTLNVHDGLAEALGEDLLDTVPTEDGVPTAQVAPDAVFAAGRVAHDYGYSILSLLSAYDTGDAIGVLYAFVKPAATPDEFGEVRFRTEVARKDDEGNDVQPVTQSIVALFPAAGWHEREMWDLYGIRFEGNPDHRRIFLPEGWKGHPARKDDKTPEQFVAMRDGEDVVVDHEEEGAW